MGASASHRAGAGHARRVAARAGADEHDRIDAVHLGRMVRKSSVMVSADLERLRETLSRTGQNGPDAMVEPSQAAVAAVLRGGAAGLGLLFIRRAERDGDPWSGQMAFPGGHLEPGDGSALAAAVRETREELELDLDRDSRHLGALSVVRTHLSNGQGPRWVAPFVFELLGDPPLVPSDEVQEAVWVPVEFLLDDANRGTLVWTHEGAPLQLPCYRFEGRVIWGLTLRMVDELLGHLAGPGWKHMPAPR